MEHRSASLSRQRDEAQRIVVHLRSLIEGQTHHMEHIIRNLAASPDVSEYIEQQTMENSQSQNESLSARTQAESPMSVKRLSRPGSRVRLSSAFSSRSSSVNDTSNNVSPEMENHLQNMDKSQRRLSQMSSTDVSDRYLRDKTDAIAAIIRNISEQCAAAVEGLHLAQDAENEEGSIKEEEHAAPSEQSRDEGSEMGEGDSNYSAENRTSSIPPTPDLVHNRSSTSMSMVSTSTLAERSSQQYNPGDIPTKIVEDEDEHLHETEGYGDHNEPSAVSKQRSQDIVLPSGPHVVS
jgi:hypothetical protein